MKRRAGDSAPPDTALVRNKLEWARQRRFLTRGAPVRAGRERLPPGQHTVNGWPVLDLGETPDTTTDRWRLEAFGEVKRPMAWNWAALQALPQHERVSDIHCVTTWSRFDNHWRGLSTQQLAAVIEPTAEARFVLLHARDGYTTNLPIEDFLADGVLLAFQWEGRPLGAEHGGPLRLVVPHLYFWKSAKWLQRIEFRRTDAPGYWEQRGYHARGDPWREQRYSDD